MKKYAVIGLAVVASAGMAFAQDDVVVVEQQNAVATDTAMQQPDAANVAEYNEGDAEVSAQVSLFSAYVWRGQVYNNDLVLQPQMTIAKYGISFNLWANWDIGENMYGNSSDFSEIDMTLAYALPLPTNAVALSVGATSYNFPNNCDDDIVTRKGNGGPGDSTMELFAKLSLLPLQQFIVPSVTVFGDIKEADGVYVLLDAYVPLQLSEYLGFQFGASAGWGSTSYNDYYFGKGQDQGWNDYNFYVNAAYDITDNWSLTANLTYTFLAGGSVDDAGGDIYEENAKLWGGAGIAYNFF